MSMFSGMLAGAAEGGAQAANQVATGQIEKQAKIDYAREISAMEEQKALRLAEFQEQQRRGGKLWDTTGEGGAASLAYGAKEGAQRSEQAVSQAKAMIPVQVEGANAMSAGTRENRVADAKAMSEAQTKAEIAAVNAKASDAGYLANMTKITLADPRVAAQIAASRASAASAYASAAHSNASTEGVKLANEDKKRLGGLYDELTSTLYDTDLSDDQRAKSMAKISTQIQSIKAKNGQGAGRDPELDTQTVTEEKLNPDGSTTKTTRKEVRKAGAAGAKDEGDPIKAAMDKARADRAKATEGAPAKPRGMINIAASAEPPALGDIDKQVYTDLQPLAQQYQQARAQLQAVSKSGDSQALQRYSQAVNQLGTQLRQQAEERLGNGAQRFLATVL